VIKDYGDIPGWFWWLDRRMFETALGVQSDSDPGTLVELGTYLGKSAVIIGNFVREQDRFVALDLFGRSDLLNNSAEALANRSENQKSYKTLSRQQFEANYLALHPTLPEIVEAPSSEIVDHVKPGEARFIHIDASHLYGAVSLDALNARTLLRPGGVVVFDDWRAEHTPGVSAAVWESVFCNGLIPVALTSRKFYGVFTDPEPYRDAFAALVRGDNRLWVEEQQIVGQPVLRIGQHETKPAAPAAEVTLSDATVDAVVKRLKSELETLVAAAVTKQPAHGVAAGATGAGQGVEFDPVRPAAAPKRSAAASTGRASRRSAGAPLVWRRRLARALARNVAPPAVTRWALARRSNRGA
jgi:hypothetical protein